MLGLVFRLMQGKGEWRKPKVIKRRRGTYTGDCIATLCYVCMIMKYNTEVEGGSTYIVDGGGGGIY